MKHTAQREEAIKKLRDLLQPGDTVYTVLRHVSRSGMSRWIDCYVMRDNEPFYISWWVAHALEWNINRKKHEGIEVGGCGMDMGTHLVMTLSGVLFREGFGCIGEKCPSNDHFNGDRDFTPNGGILNGMAQESENRTHWHKSGDYSIKQRWL